MMKDKSRLLGEEKMSKTLLIMGAPTMIGMLVSALYNFVDAYYVGKLGTLPMAAVSVVNPLSYIGMFVGLLFGCGGNSVIARAFGRGSKEDVKKYSASALYIALFVISVLIILTIIFLNPVLHILGSLPQYDDLAREYAIIFTLGLFFNVYNMCMNNMIVAEGNSSISMLAMLIGAVVNIILDPVFIFTFGMGVFGAGLATMISRIVSTIIYTCYVMSKNSMLSINLCSVSLKKKTILDIVSVGIPVALFQLINGGAQTVLNNLARKYGVDAQAAIGIVNKIMFLELNLLYGFFKGCSPVVGYNYGAGNMKRVREATRLALIWSIGATFICGTILVLFRSDIMYIFNQESEQVVRIGAFALVVYALSYLTYGYQIIIGNFFIAIGEVKRGGLLSLGKGIIYMIYLVVMERLLGLQGLILAQACTDITGTIITKLVHNDYNRKQC